MKFIPVFSWLKKKVAPVSGPVNLGQRILSFLGIDLVELDYLQPGSYFEELNHQGRVWLIPTALFAIFFWTPYFRLDFELYPNLPLLFYLRLGLSLLGLAILTVQFFPFFRKRSYALLIILFFYIFSVSALITGITGADPVYLGGFALIIVLTPIIPFTRIHNLFLLLFTLVIYFTVLAFGGNLGQSWFQRSGFINFITAIVFALVLILIMDNIRKKSYGKGYLIQQTNEALQQSNLELSTLNQELEQLSRTLLRQNEELEEANKIKGEILGIAAHDLKDPLQVIMGYAEMLQETLTDNSQALEKAARIYSSSERMFKLINRLLEDAVIKKGKLELNKCRVDMDGLISSVIKQVQPKAGSKAQQINYKKQNNINKKFSRKYKDNYPVWGDPQILQQVVKNILSNAIKFSPRETSIDVELEQTIDEVIIRVRDQGPGFSAEDYPKMFKRFQRLSARPTAKESSTGLGLAITKDFVDLHKGDIFITNRPGTGSTVTIKFISPGIG